MLLCDIGNTSVHFFDGSRDYKESVTSFGPSVITEKIYYICVNSNLKSRVKFLENWIDLSLYIDTLKYYKGMGIDRVAACEAIQNGIVVDAGSAITVDLVKDGIFQGGFIYPGVKAMGEAYKNISSALECSFNFELDLDKMPKNSQDAISYGFIKTLFVEVMSHNMEIYLTGGYAKEFSKIFKSASVDELLIFKGMKNIMKKANLC